MKYFVFFLAVISLCCCKSDKNVKVKFSNEINEYNYLDKPHDLKYVYDFQNVLTDEEISKIYNKLKKINEGFKTTIIIVIDKKSFKRSFKDNTIVTNNIFMNKYKLNKSVTLKISLISKELSIAYSKSLEKELNDSICSVVIEKTIKPNFKNEKFYEGVDMAIDSLVKCLE